MLCSSGSEIQDVGINPEGGRSSFREGEGEYRGNGGEGFWWSAGVLGSHRLVPSKMMWKRRDLCGPVGLHHC